MPDIDRYLEVEWGEFLPANADARTVVRKVLQGHRDAESRDQEIREAAATYATRMTGRMAA